MDLWICGFADLWICGFADSRIWVCGVFSKWDGWIVGECPDETGVP